MWGDTVITRTFLYIQQHSLFKTTNYNIHTSSIQHRIVHLTIYIHDDRTQSKQNSVLANEGHPPFHRVRRHLQALGCLMLTRHVHVDGDLVVPLPERGRVVREGRA